MNGTESLTRTLPDEPTRLLTPKAVEMPFGAFEVNDNTNRIRRQ